MAVNYIETESRDPAFNLAFEQYILENKLEGDWLLLWQNDNTVVIGLNQNTSEEINADFIKEHNVNVVRRMTGGGAVYHDLGNLNYSFITDVGDKETLTISRFTEPVCKALAQMGIKAETTGRNDITIDGKKVSGVAQRIYKDRILHHGTLLFDSNIEMLSGCLNVDPAKFASKSSKSVKSRVGMIKDYMPQGATIETFWNALRDNLSTEGINKPQLSEAELEEINRNAQEKYRSWEWTYGRNPRFDYSNKVRWPGGSLDIRLSVKQGCITDIVFAGDYMAKKENTALVEKLIGTAFSRDEIERVLNGEPIQDMFGEITIENILDTMLYNVM